MMAGTDVITVLVTAPGREPALVMARRVVEESLAACANVIPNVTSIFRWDGKVTEAAEVLLILKTSTAKSPALIARLAELHTYDVPEVLCLRVEDGFGPYLDWVGECTSTESFDGRT